MKGETKCEICNKLFIWTRSKNQKSKPRFCSWKCRKEFGHIGFKPGGNYRIDKTTPDEKLKKLKDAFEKKVIKKEGCWDWVGPFDEGNYPIMSCDRRYGPDRGHRASWIIYKGPIPKGMLVCHQCDNPRCTNPQHLWIGTHKENAKDMIEKKRKANGEKTNNSKLKTEDVIEIKKLIKLGFSYPKISKMYEVAYGTIARIKRGETWKHVEP